MKNNNVIFLSVFSLLAIAGGSSHAADSATLFVTASVVANCQITGSAPVPFGALDPSSNGTVTATGSVSFWCTKGAGWSLTANNGANATGTQKRMKGPGAADFIPYTLTLATSSGSGAGAGTPVTVNANGSVASTAFANATQGTYSDTVTVSITP